MKDWRRRFHWVPAKISFRAHADEMWYEEDGTGVFDDVAIKAYFAGAKTHGRIAIAQVESFLPALPFIRRRQYSAIVRLAVPAHGRFVHEVRVPRGYDWESGARAIRDHWRGVS